MVPFFCSSSLPNQKLYNDASFTLKFTLRWQKTPKRCKAANTFPHIEFIIRRGTSSVGLAQGPFDRFSVGAGDWTRDQRHDAPMMTIWACQLQRLALLTLMWTNAPLQTFHTCHSFRAKEGRYTNTKDCPQISTVTRQIQGYTSLWWWLSEVAMCKHYKRMNTCYTHTHTQTPLTNT